MMGKVKSPRERERKVVELRERKRKEEKEV